ncbi:hypothetical protein C5C14_02310 [Rathayibacter rathayi]|nr:hypothetical protein C5C34_09915 [Rathayibacter rathayi]PPF83243.1 hypothetical protein C5C14_02310 [Rathayibacter rathayi]PPH38989.1 hypothetical protein C5C28_02120 [Rathayibacter rathayi]
MEGGGFSASMYRASERVFTIENDENGGANMLTYLTTKGRHQGPEITRLVTTAEQVYGPDAYAPDERFVILVLANAYLDDAEPEQRPAAVEGHISQMLAAAPMIWTTPTASARWRSSETPTSSLPSRRHPSRPRA